jgi:diguanylate cyclase (GGDEF)-like protein/PAS domain S-box-containing protein
MPDDALFAALIAEHVCDGIVLTDAKGEVVWINPAFTRISGYELSEMLGKRPGDLLQGADTSAESKAALAEAIRTRTPLTEDIVNYSKAGVPYISEINISPIFHESGELRFFVAVQRDVTSQRSDAQESTDFKAYQQALNQQAIVSVADARGVITYVNDKFCAISGFAPEELIGKTHRVVNSGTHERTFFRDMWRMIRTGRTWHGEVCNRTKAGDLYWVDTTVVPVHGPRGDIVRYVSTRYEITERKSAEAELRRMAEVDALTGLANRTRFAFDLNRRLAASLNGKSSKGGLVAMFDLDHFKDLNDTLGHHYGDLLLKEIGRRLIAFTGPDCLVARLGGDEFAALIPAELLGDNPSEFIQSLHKSACEAVSLDDRIYMPSFSMGVTRYPRDAETVEGLMINADVALYEAKRHGRNQWCFFEPAVRNRLKYREHLKAVLVDALENDHFEIVLQPICCLQTLEHRAFEILVRLQHDGQNIPPDHFVPLAEELGLIAPIGRLVMRKAMAAHMHMVKAGLSPGMIAINVAAPEFRDPSFVEDVQDLLFEYGMSPRDLAVEITETALIGRSTETVAKVLHQLQALGVQVALDDFGTGFSSLSHLKDFRVDKIKIDKSFVQDLDSDESDRALVDGLIALARRIGLQVVAEGVETQGQLDYLRRCGCDYLQGYLHSKPLSVEDAMTFLRAAPKTRSRAAEQIGDRDMQPKRGKAQS